MLYSDIVLFLKLQTELPRWPEYDAGIHLNLLPKLKICDQSVFWHPRVDIYQQVLYVSVSTTK
jgi:hypothetical protein